MSATWARQKPYYTKKYPRLSRKDLALQIEPLFGVAVEAARAPVAAAAFTQLGQRAALRFFNADGDVTVLIAKDFFKPLFDAFL